MLPFATKRGVQRAEGAAGNADEQRSRLQANRLQVHLKAVRPQRDVGHALLGQMDADVEGNGVEHRQGSREGAVVRLGLGREIALPREGLPIGGARGVSGRERANSDDGCKDAAVNHGGVRC